MTLTIKQQQIATILAGPKALVKLKWLCDSAASHMLILKDSDMDAFTMIKNMEYTLRSYSNAVAYINHKMLHAIKQGEDE